MNGLDVDDDADLWHPSGWSPVYDGVSSVRHLVGFTTLQVRVDEFRMSRPAERQDIPGAFVFTGRAKRVLRSEFYGWVVENGDWRDMPDFWAV